MDDLVGRCNGNGPWHLVTGGRGNYETVCGTGRKREITAYRRSSLWGFDATDICKPCNQRLRAAEVQDALQSGCYLTLIQVAEQFGTTSHTARRLAQKDRWRQVGKNPALYHAGDVRATFARLADEAQKKAAARDRPKRRRPLAPHRPVGLGWPG